MIYIHLPWGQKKKEGINPGEALPIWNISHGWTMAMHPSAAKSNDGRSL